MHPDEVGLEDLPLDENLEVLHATIEMLGSRAFPGGGQSATRARG